MSADPLEPLLAAIESRDFVALREVLATRSAELGEYVLRSFMTRALEQDDLDVVKLLAEFDAKVDIDASDPWEAPLQRAATCGAESVVKWLLGRGAKVNLPHNGQTTCLAISGAAGEGHLGTVKLLVDHGADVNAVWIDQNALSMAMMYGHHEVADYLRSVGGKLPQELRSQPGRSPRTDSGTFDAQAILAHFSRHLGKANPLALQEVIPTSPAISIHTISLPSMLVAFTCGMSQRPMSTPSGADGLRFAELVIHLPPTWPVEAARLADAKHRWPFDWLRRLAQYPHQHNTWLGGNAVVFANDEPPRPLAPNTRLTCLLAMTEDSDFGALLRPDGSQVVFYTLFPLYTEERDLERQLGVRRLIELFQEHEVDPVVDIARPNLGKAPPRHRRR